MKICLVVVYPGYKYLVLQLISYALKKSKRNEDVDPFDFKFVLSCTTHKFN